MPKVLVQDEALEVELEKNENLRLGLRRQKISVYDGIITGSLNCRGKGLCGTCRVIVIDGRDNLSVPSERETSKLKEKGIAAGLRLSCQALVTGDIQIHCHP